MITGTSKVESQNEHLARVHILTNGRCDLCSRGNNLESHTMNTKRTSISRRLSIRARGGFIACARSTRSSSFDFDRNSFWCCSAVTATLSSSPRHLSFGRLSSSVPGGCIGSYAAVASCPPYFRMTLAPPGCSYTAMGAVQYDSQYVKLTGRKSVTS